MRLVLDELYTQAIAVGLRERGHDVISVHERGDLESLEDAQLFVSMAAERRAIVTENWPDYQRELTEAAASGRDHYGVLCTSRNRMPRSKRTTGLYIRILDDFLRRHPDEDALLNSYRWLPEPAQANLVAAD